MTPLEQKLFVALRLMTRYAACLESECARLGNVAVRDPRNVTIANARALLAEFRSTAP